MQSDNTPAARRSGRPAHLGWRLLALTYDGLPMIPLLMLTSGLFLLLHGGRTVENDPLFASAEFAALWLIVGCYFVISWRRGGQTMGMRPWRLQVLAADGLQASLRALWLRFVVACLTPGLCLLWTLVDRERRGLHDLAAGTVLVRLDPPPKN